MLPTPMKQWDASKIKQFNQQSPEALLCDEATLFAFSQDFGRVMQSQPAAVYQPHSIEAIQNLIRFAQNEQLPLTIRGNGLSQGGQSLPLPGGVTLSMQQFDKPGEFTGDSIWMEANASWTSLLEQTLPALKAPHVLPYNCNLAVAGVLSVGGVGASSFKYGTINSHVKGLEVIDGLGELQRVDYRSPLFDACLSGQGRCGVITKAEIALRTVQPLVKTFCLVYNEQDKWFKDLEKLKTKADYLELFCSPAIQGAKPIGDKRQPVAEWLYALHCSFEFTEQSPELTDLVADLHYWKLLQAYEESIGSYYLRHNSRFVMMKSLGQWDLLHPWYECFVPTKVLQTHLEAILQSLPLHYANLVHIVPISRPNANFLMFPKEDSVCSFMILHPGIPQLFKDSCLQAVEELDKRFLQLGGKRYLSGYMGKAVGGEYWSTHFAEYYKAWMDVKKQYDPAGIFCSLLHPK
ncbi:MAG: FAD-binding oxidoreductase [Legionella sp.]|nr:MAG: FAD-binding oxidoreductase [Legionella sp.]